MRDEILRIALTTMVVIETLGSVIAISRIFLYRTTRQRRDECRLEEDDGTRTASRPVFIED